MSSSNRSPKKVVKQEVAEAFPRLTRDQISAVAALARIEMFTTGETVIREGSYANGFYVIVSGKAEVLQFDDANVYVKLRNLEPGNFFGEIGLLTQPRRTATVRARTKLEVAALSNDAFFELMQKSPVTAKAMMQVGARRASRPLPKPRKKPAPKPKS